MDNKYNNEELPITLYKKLVIINLENRNIKIEDIVRDRFFTDLEKEELLLKYS